MLEKILRGYFYTMIFPDYNVLGPIYLDDIIKRNYVLMRVWNDAASTRTNIEIVKRRLSACNKDHRRRTDL